MARKSLFIKNQACGIFSIFCVILTIILIVAFSTSSILRFYVFFEASLIPTFLLILGWGYQPERLQAGLYLLLYTITASLPLLISIGVISNYSKRLIFYMPIWRVGGFVRIIWG